MFHRLTVLNGGHLRLLWFDRLRFWAQRRRHVGRHNRNRQLPHPPVNGLCGCAVRCRQRRGHAHAHQLHNEHQHAQAQRPVLGADARWRVIPPVAQPPHPEVIPAAQACDQPHDIDTPSGVWSGR
ncbi:hypothetical protein XfCFBP8356_005180 [Xylella fastidiosa subsp. sandyi]